MNHQKVNMDQGEAGGSSYRSCIEAIQLVACIDELTDIFEKVQMECLNRYADLGSKELRLFGYLGNHGKAKMKDLASVLNVPASTATYIVDNMVRKGYLKRTHDRSDRRLVWLEMSGKGVEVFSCLLEGKVQRAEEILGSLSEEEAETVLFLLNRILYGRN